MIIKRLAPADLDSALKTIRELKTEPENKPSPTVESLSKLLENRDAFLLAAFEGEEPVGFLTAYKLKMVYTSGYMLLLYEINVREDRRRRGIGSSLIQDLKNRCPGENIDRLWLLTNKSNAKAVALYRKMGLKTVGIEDDLLFSMNPEGSVLG